MIWGGIASPFCQSAICPIMATAIKAAHMANSAQAMTARAFRMRRMVNPPIELR